MNIETIQVIGTIADFAEGHMPRQSKMSEKLRKERELLFSKAKPKQDKEAKKRVAPDDVNVQFFLERGKRFLKVYGYPRTQHRDLQLFMAYLSNLLGIELVDILSQKRSAKLVLARKIVAFFAYYYFGLIQVEIAELINRERSTITTHVPEFLKEMETYYDTREKALKCDSFLYAILKRRKKYNA
jgi:chromosomal replication initiation ATPase DnaA